ncbi:MAG: hypothetical protein WCJ29_04280 [bacterium]
MTFTKKKISADETVGGYFRELLNSARMTDIALAEALHAQPRHVKALLNNDFKQLPGAYYTKHLIKKCSELLNGRAEYAESLFLRSVSTSDIVESPEKIFEYRRVRGAALIVVARVLTGLAFVGVFAALMISFGGNIRKALTPPSIDLLNPATDLVTSNRELKVEGKTEPEVIIKINGEQVVTDDVGVFSMPLYLNDGLNIVEVRAAKRYSKEQVVYRRVLVEYKDSKEVSIR